MTTAYKLTVQPGANAAGGPVPIAPCRCGLGDVGWRDLRGALGITQVQFARLLMTSYRAIQRAEATGHVCPQRHAIANLIDLLYEPWVQDAIVASDRHGQAANASGYLYGRGWAFVYGSELPA